MSHRKEMPAIKKVEHLNGHAVGVKAFRSAFIREHRSFEQFTRELATGKAGFGKTKEDLLGMSGIGVGAAILNTVIAMLTGVGVLSGMLSIALGLTAALVTIGANIGFSVYRNRLNRAKYQNAAKFMDEMNLHDFIDHIRSKVSHQFSDYLNHCTEEQGKDFAKNTHRIIADAILNRKIKSVAELTRPVFMLQYQKHILPVPPKTTFSFVNIFKRMKENIVLAWRSRKNQEKPVVSVANANAGLFKSAPAPKYAPVSKPSVVTEPVRPRI